MKTSTEHAALSAELAWALGWTTYHVGDYIHVDSPTDREPRVFDYRAPDVYGPLIEWLLTEHNVTIARSSVGFRVTKFLVSDVANTLPEAVARAVIAMKGKP